MLTYNEIRERKYIILAHEPYEVLASHVFRKQQRKPVNQTKLRHLISGRVIEHSFQSSDKVEEADVSKVPVRYLYTKVDKTGAGAHEYWFADSENPKERFQLEATIVQDPLKWIKENEMVEALTFTAPTGDPQIIGLSVPIKVELTVTDAPPNVKGNTAQGGTKQVTLETGAVVSTPLFIETGDIVRINTETGDYVERVEKG